MKKTIIGVTCLLSLCLMTACGGSGSGASSKAAGSSSAAESSGAMVGMANPWVDFGTPEEASKATGFTMEVPDKFDGNPRTLVQAIKNEMMQVFYSDKAIGLEGTKKTIIRKSNKKGDISGDYNDYKKTETVKVNDIEATFKGDGTKVFNITWTAGDYSYAIMSDTGISSGEAMTMVSLVK